MAADIKQAFGRRVRRLRERLGETQEDFANRVGLDRSYYGEVERGRINISLENIVRIADGLGVPPAALFRF